MSTVADGPRKRRARCRKMTPDLLVFGDALRGFLGLKPLYIVDPDSRYGRTKARRAEEQPA